MWGSFLRRRKSPRWAPPRSAPSARSWRRRTWRCTEWPSRAGSCGRRQAASESRAFFGVFYFGVPCRFSESVGLDRLNMPFGSPVTHTHRHRGGPEGGLACRAARSFGPEPARQPRKPSAAGHGASGRGQSVGHVPKRRWANGKTVHSGL